MTLPDILLIDKPAGMTSFDVIRHLRRATGVRKFGHAGTLDPMATGLMILGVNEGTKKLQDYIKLDKVYEADILIGESRSTGDVTGALLEEADVVEIEERTAKQALQSLVGIHRLPVSAYSAIKKDGVPMYKRARAAAKIGDLVQDIPYRDMEVHQVRWDGFRQETHARATISATFHVASGVYIRSLAEELGRILGYPATLASLRRTQIGDFSINDARRLDEF